MSKDNWHKTDYGKQRVFGELKRIEEQGLKMIYIDYEF